MADAQTEQPPNCAACAKPLAKASAKRIAEWKEGTVDDLPPVWGMFGDNFVCNHACGHALLTRLAKALSVHDMMAMLAPGQLTKPPEPVSTEAAAELRKAAAFNRWHQEWARGMGVTDVGETYTCHSCRKARRVATMNGVALCNRCQVEVRSPEYAFIGPLRTDERCAHVVHRFSGSHVSHCNQRAPYSGAKDESLCVRHAREDARAGLSVKPDPLDNILRDPDEA